MSTLRRFLPSATLALAVAAFCLYELSGVGVLGPDEPRYAAIGRAMAQTGDFVTPRLWGAPWFEKPPLLYWMTALGTSAGLSPELSGRLPVALLSLIFLVASFVLLRREFGVEAAAVSTFLLATSAGWATYSNLCLTDLPLAVCFSCAVWLALRLLRGEPQNVRWTLLGIGVCLGLAALAKGLVPLVLSIPFLWFLRRLWRNWWIAVLGCAVVALPWYLAVYLRNGYPFIQDFFLKHHLERVYSVSLQHVQPWYYYFPVLLAGLFPWTPLLGLLAVRRDGWDIRRRFLLSLVVFGFLFFSITLNKLPGYLLPLIPSLFVLIGAQFEGRGIAQLGRAWLAPCAAFIAAIPLLTTILPQALSAGRLSTAAFSHITRPEWFYIAIPIATVLLARRAWAGALLVLCVAAEGIYLKATVYPVLDAQVSARGLWRQIEPISTRICDGGANRDWIYGLSFYRGALIPPCAGEGFDHSIRSHGHGIPSVEPIN